MLTNEEENPKFTKEETTQINEAQRRLHVLENEISIATKNLSVTKKDAEKAYKEKIYQENLLSETKDKVRQASEFLNELLDQIRESKEILEKNTELAQKINTENEEKSNLLNQKEKELFDFESDLKSKSEDYNIKLSELSKEQVSISTAKYAFLKATETVTWK